VSPATGHHRSRDRSRFSLIAAAAGGRRCPSQRRTGRHRVTDANRDATTGKGDGATAMWGYIVGGVGLLIAVTSIILAFNQ
jgi:hypothetical protein